MKGMFSNDDINKGVALGLILSLCFQCCQPNLCRFGPLLPYWLIDLLYAKPQVRGFGYQVMPILSVGGLRRSSH